MEGTSLQKSWPLCKRLWSQCLFLSGPPIFMLLVLWNVWLLLHASSALSWKCVCGHNACAGKRNLNNLNPVVQAVLLVAELWCQHRGLPWGSAWSFFFLFPLPATHSWHCCLWHHDDQGAGWCGMTITVVTGRYRDLEGCKTIVQEGCGHYHQAYCLQFDGCHRMANCALGASLGAGTARTFCTMDTIESNCMAAILCTLSWE